MGWKLGVLPMLGGPGAAEPGVTAAFVRQLESLGCESVWAVEHLLMPDAYHSSYPYDASGRMSLLPGDDIPDPLHWLTFAAAHTSRLVLGTAMLILPLHHPVALAKRLATLDVLSGGRLIAGVGVGWLREEYDAVGVPFSDRGRRADEYLDALRTLWSDAPATHHGATVHFDAVHSAPRPTRPSGVPIMIGGHSRAAVRRAARYGTDFYPLGVDAAGLAELLTLLRAECAALGRDPTEVAVTSRAPATRAEADALRELGVARVVIRADPRDPERVAATVNRYRQEILGE
ncbi:LLM class F420-dependent oxidoreductase [Micromonospora sp. DSM 115977]|uniref:LLM class F420-dependent oxidoreductase n=1 Tax=Micromonospora reichwaldensis TaxID=3075516 RepID=A0ABU2WY54_9ACTN|nr:LLM class F420-dependent oxidoreductase [Micromonospora sp. DSM 115977]MDT0530544.1 LLM class F420-dependent oxidoreductase [Micromonospora sp. DSM 115977]